MHMKRHAQMSVAVAAGILIGWFSNAQIVKGQGKQADTPVVGKLSHFGFAVADVEKTAKAFEDVFGVQNVPKSQDFRDIKWGSDFPGKIMHVRRIGMTINDITFELLQPLPPDDSPWAQFIKSGGDGLHHIGFSVPDVTKAHDYLKSKGGVQTQEFSMNGKVVANYIDMHKAGVPITFEITPLAPAPASAAQR
jgi:catechol 2,3-dioxygenase-like lactoylglutathione lyase family enzyme